MTNLRLQAAGEWERQRNLPIDEHARGVIKMLCDMNGGDPATSTGPSKGDAAAERHCAALGICLNSDTGCGAGIRTNADFAAFRARMWARWKAGN